MDPSWDSVWEDWDPEKPHGASLPGNRVGRICRLLPVSLSKTSSLSSHKWMNQVTPVWLKCLDGPGIEVNNSSVTYWPLWSDMTDLMGSVFCFPLLKKTTYSSWPWSVDARAHVWIRLSLTCKFSGCCQADLGLNSISTIYCKSFNLLKSQFSFL